MLTKAHLTLIVLLCLGFKHFASTTESVNEEFYTKLIDFLYSNYPEFISRLLLYNGTTFGLNTSVLDSKLYSGYALEAKHKDGYSVLLSNSFRQRMRNGLTESSTQVHNVLYKCRSAIHYCTGNPNYCSYDEGDEGTKIIIVAGHDGPLRPKSIPDRVAGCWSPKSKICIYKHDCENKTENIFKSNEHCTTKDEDDVATTDIASSIVSTLERLTGKRPHLIVNRIHRLKLDVNREIGLGAFHVPEAEEAYIDFHSFIKMAKESFKGDWGLLLDIHGNNRGEWTMLGYGMYKYQFDFNTLSANDSSLRGLAEHTNVTFETLLRGNNSLGYFIEESGGKVFPSPNNPSPLNKDYLTGGYITTSHGSKHGGNIDAIQIEIPNVVRDKAGDELSYISKLAQAIVKFIDVNYNQYGKISIEPER